MTATTEQPAAHTLAEPARGLRGSVLDWVDRVRGGDVGSLPAILGLAVLTLVFAVLRPDTFTQSFNFANLINQSSAVIVIAMGLVFVLLLGLVV